MKHTTPVTDDHFHVFIRQSDLDRMRDELSTHQSVSKRILKLAREPDDTVLDIVGRLQSECDELSEHLDVARARLRDEKSNMPELLEENRALRASLDAAKAQVELLQGAVESQSSEARELRQLQGELPRFRAAMAVAEAVVRIAGDGAEPGSCNLSDVAFCSDGDDEAAMNIAIDRYRSVREKQKVESTCEENLRAVAEIERLREENVELCGELHDYQDLRDLLNEELGPWPPMTTGNLVSAVVKALFRKRAAVQVAEADQRLRIHTCGVDTDMMSPPDHKEWDNDMFRLSDELDAARVEFDRVTGE